MRFNSFIIDFIIDYMIIISFLKSQIQRVPGFWNEYQLPPVLKPSTA